MSSSNDRGVVLERKHYSDLQMTLEGRRLPVEKASPRILVNSLLSERSNCIQRRLETT